MPTLTLRIDDKIIEIERDAFFVYTLAKHFQSYIEKSHFQGALKVLQACGESYEERVIRAVSKNYEMTQKSQNLTLLDNFLKSPLYLNRNNPETAVTIHMQDNPRPTVKRKKERLVKPPAPSVLTVEQVLALSALFKAAAVEPNPDVPSATFRRT